MTSCAATGRRKHERADRGDRLRLVGDEEQWDGSGLSADDAAEIAAGYEAEGLVDFVHVSVGTSGIGMVRTNYARPGLGVTAASTVRAALSGSVCRSSEVMAPPATKPAMSTPR